MHRNFKQRSQQTRMKIADYLYKMLAKLISPQMLRLLLNLLLKSLLKRQTDGSDLQTKN